MNKQKLTNLPWTEATRQTIKLITFFAAIGIILSSCKNIKRQVRRNEGLGHFGVCYASGYGVIIISDTT